MNGDSKLDVWSHFETTKQRQRLVLLGASNLTRAFPTVVGTALARFESPLSIFAAMGNGRSYGKESRFLGKKFPGIFQCGIWEALRQQKKISTTAFVTDIGNDLAYEVPVETLVGWVDECLERLQSFGARVVLSDLPLEVLRGVGAARYRLFRSVFFPACRLDWSEMLRRAEHLSQCLHRIAKARKTPVFIGKNEWYGWDPIHPRRANYRFLWRDLFDAIDSKPRQRQTYKRSLLMTMYLRGLRPETWSAYSISRHARQPHGRLCDGTEIALY